MLSGNDVYPIFQDSREFRKKLNHLAEKAAQEAIPRTYNLNYSDPEKNHGPVRFFTLGCQGNKSEAQAQVARLMADIAHDPHHKPDFVVILGDNFYQWGVGSADDKAFYEYFEKVYQDLAALNIPCFVVLGNHDANFHRINALVPEKGVARSLHQVAHSYYGNTEEQKKLYSKDTLLLDKLPLWNMPARAYSIIKGDTQVFCIDSNTYVLDYLEYLEKKDNTPPQNQAKWLAEEVKKAKQTGRKTFLAMHHPLFTTGIRAYHSDINCYFTRKEKEKLKKIFTYLSDDYPYNYLLKDCFIKQGLIFDTTLAAHDHNICYYNNIANCISKEEEQLENTYPLCQIISGGGGGSLQLRVNFEEQDKLGCFFEHHGFTEVECNPDNIYFTIRTINPNYHLEFTNHSCKPIRAYPDEMEQEEKNAIQKFCTAMHEAISRYFNFLAPQQQNKKGRYHFFNFNHGKIGNLRAHEVWDYISNHSADNYQKTVETVYNIARWEQSLISKFFTNPNQDSFITHINKVIKEFYGKNESLESLYRKSHSVISKNAVLTH